MTHCRTTELEGTPTHLILQMGAPHTPQFPPWVGLAFPVIHSANLPHSVDPDRTLLCPHWHPSGQQIRETNVK